MTAKFPVSQTVPAAEIKAKKKNDKNNNYAITLIAKNLASVDRLAPPRETYVVWIAAEGQGIKNVGQWAGRNARKSVFETVTPFNVREIFITAEDDGTVGQPTGIEISRVFFRR